MYTMKIKILSITIIALFATNIVALKIKMTDLSAGDIININYLNPGSTETYGGIFDGHNNNASHFIELDKLAGVEQISIENKICLPFKSLASYYYPSVNVDDKKFDLSKILNFTYQDNLFDISPYYIRDKYSYGIVKVCHIVKSQKLISEVLNQNDVLMLNDHINYKLLLDRTGVLRFRQENETHYVSLITTGKCLLQVYVNLAELCGQNPATDIDIENFIKFSRHSSRIKITSGDRDQENQINDYANLFQKTLYDLRSLESDTSFYDKLKSVSENSTVELILKTLPDLPGTVPPLVVISEKFLSDIVPGDVIDVNSLNRLGSLIKTDNILVDISEHKTEEFTAFNLTNCNQFHENDPIQLEIAPYGLHSNYFTEPFYKFDVFDEVMRRRNYGVDPKYLNKRFKCLKVKICSAFKTRKLIIPSVYVINLDKNQTHESRVFESQNVVLRYRLGNETHYVTRTEKGNCLFQALMYENLDDSSHNQNIQKPLLFRGKILSANNDQNLEKWAENPPKNYKTLMELILDWSAVRIVLSKLAANDDNDVYTNIYLNKLN